MTSMSLLAFIQRSGLKLVVPNDMDRRTLNRTLHLLDVMSPEGEWEATSADKACDDAWEMNGERLHREGR